jgi:hypothetical protein
MQKTSGKMVKNLLNLFYDYDEIVKKCLCILGTFPRCVVFHPMNMYL